jgi:hypothetical protein
MVCLSPTLVAIAFAHHNLSLPAMKTKLLWLDRLERKQGEEARIGMLLSIELHDAPCG